MVFPWIDNFELDGKILKNIFRVYLRSYLGLFNMHVEFSLFMIFGIFFLKCPSEAKMRKFRNPPYGFFVTERCDPFLILIYLVPTPFVLRECTWLSDFVIQDDCI